MTTKTNFVNENTAQLVQCYFLYVLLNNDNNLQIHKN